MLKKVAFNVYILQQTLSSYNRSKFEMKIFFLKNALTNNNREKEEKKISNKLFLSTFSPLQMLSDFFFQVVYGFDIDIERFQFI